MSGQLERAVAALHMGRNAGVVSMEVAAIVAVIPALWLATTLFLALEPMP